MKNGKYYSEVIKNCLKKLVMTKEDDEDFKNSTKCWIYDNDYVANGVKVRERDHCNITGKYNVSAHRNCNINLNLNHNLKIFDSHLIMQELAKISIKINIMPNGLEKYMSFTINNKFY